MRQGTRKQQDRLAAQSYLYTRAKQVHVWQLVVIGPVMIIFTLVAIATPSLQIYTAFFAMCATLFETLCLNAWQDRFRRQAARVQELFDCDSLSIPWNSLKCGDAPSIEFINSQVVNYEARNGDFSKFQEWYPAVCFSLPDDLSRIACQRINCRWDRRLRKRYSGAIVAGILVALCIMVCVALRLSFTVENTLRMAVIPFFPSLVFAARQWREHNEAEKRLEHIEKYSQMLWYASLKKSDNQELRNQARQLQDEILENRSRSPLIWDWVYKVFRKDYEANMRNDANALVREARDMLGLNASD